MPRKDEPTLFSRSEDNEDTNTSSVIVISPESVEVLAHFHRPQQTSRKRIQNDPGSSHRTNSNNIPEDLRIFLGESSIESLLNLLRECTKKHPITFNEIFDKERRNLRLIGSGSFAKCYQLLNTSIFKVALFQEKDKREFEEVKGELLISKYLSELRDNEHNKTSGFSSLLGCWVVWDVEMDSLNQSSNTKKLYMVHHMEYAGQPLYDVVKENALTPKQIFSIIGQIALSLLAAERELQFEHRDLHLKNILLQQSNRTELIYKVDDDEYSIDPSGWIATIIDFNLSRATVDGGIYSVAFKVQADDYRQQAIGNNWDGFYPKTNCHALIEVLIYLSRYVIPLKKDVFTSWLRRSKPRIAQFSLCEELLNFIISTTN